MNTTTFSSRSLRVLLAGLGLAGALGTAQAYDGVNGRYWGLSYGGSGLSTSRDPAFPNDASGHALQLQFGQNVDRHFATELGIGRLGQFQRGGGDTTVDGLSWSAVGKLPFDRITPYVKLGAVLATSKADTSALSTLPSGRETGLGLSGGVGVAFDLGERSQIVVSYDRYMVPVEGHGRESLNTRTIGWRTTY
ncbi:outer membrane beta-barrel protein [Pseudaquabacterium rugosum]|uniref:Outer membrane beta-barrel protein n=1 Tax=Pseudaquabacterium rugosum TaxID=2984194 RepID=A0ABU9B9Y8_9BURK